MRLVLTGLRAWLVQRASAVYLLGFILFFIAYFLSGGPSDYEAWRTFVAQGYVRLLILFAFLALLLHAWVGLRDVMLDYVKPVGLRVVALPLVAGGLIAVGLWVLLTLFSLH